MQETKKEFSGKQQVSIAFKMDFLEIYKGWSHEDMNKMEHYWASNSQYRDGLENPQFPPTGSW